MNHLPEAWGRPRSDVYGEYSKQISQAGPSVHTQSPSVTGTSVIAIKFDKGVMLAADHLASYGSLARFTDQQRLYKVGDETVVGISGDISDMQHIVEMLDNLEIGSNYELYGHTLRAPHIHEYLSRVMYNRRSKMDPLWNAVLVAGTGEDKKPYLAYVDLLGVTYSAPTLATGFGAYLAIPLLRKLVPDEVDCANVTEAQARAAIDECMRVLFYRDARSSDKYAVATVTTDGGVKIESDIKCQDMNWRFARNIKGYGTQKV
ncbi:nucleophile aminohydrolase [Dipodascopsis tothii]|uniref:nucleophile aminohydrolase n=1 Tax=Dipodascopsis tothii TaxID=44089 RepID=UPI0034CF547D